MVSDLRHAHDCKACVGGYGYAYDASDYVAEGRGPRVRLAPKWQGCRSRTGGSTKSEYLVLGNY